MYAKRSALQRKMPGFRVRMGFGLHLGWGIEGAIGTRHKIDASYLSPHVNMSARLEAATKQYGVTLLLTDALFDELGLATQRLCRRIDRVTVKGSSRPVTLFTFDKSPHGKETSLKVPGLAEREAATEALHLMSATATVLEEEQEGDEEDGRNDVGEGSGAARTGGESKTPITAEGSPAVSLARSSKPGSSSSNRRPSVQEESLRFASEWNRAFDCYIEGRWDQALAHMRRCLAVRPKDSPCRVLLEYVSRVGGEAAAGSRAGSGGVVRAPDGWPGYRSLHSK